MTMPRGARVRFSADQTGQDYTAGVLLAWNSEVFDTDALHDNSTNPSRLTIPKGFHWVRVEAGVYMANLTAASNPLLQIKLNGTTICGEPSHNPTTAWGTTITTGLMYCNPGDYFETILQVTGDASSDILSARSFMTIELIS